MIPEELARSYVRCIMDALPLSGIDDEALQEFIKANNLHAKVSKYALMRAVLEIVEKSLMFDHEYGTDGYPRLPRRTYYQEISVWGDCSYKVTVRVFLEEETTDVLIAEIIPHQYGSPLIGHECQVARFHVEHSTSVPEFVFLPGTDDE